MDEHGLTDDFLKVKTPDENWEFTERLCKLLDIENKENPQQGMENNGQGQGQGQEQEGEQQDDNQGQGQGEGEGEDEAQGGEGSDKKDGNGGEKTVKFSNLLHHDHADTPSYANGSLKIIYDNLGSQRGMHTPLPESAHDVIDMQDHNNSLYRDFTADDRATSTISQLVHGSTLSKRVRRLIQVTSRSKYIGGKHRGRLKSGSLSRLVSGDSRVFRSKQVNRSTDVDVTLLVDNSGSMSGRTKFENAVASSILMSQVLTQLNINHEIISFTSSGRTPYNLINKAFGRKASADELIMQSAYSRNFMSSNADGEHILFAFKRLMKQRGARKIMLVFSDGQPAGMHGIAEFTQEILREIQDKSPVEVYGIGIRSDAVEHFYDECTVINDANQLESALFEVIKRKLV